MVTKAEIVTIVLARVIKVITNQTINKKRKTKTKTRNMARNVADKHWI